MKVFSLQNISKKFFYETPSFDCLALVLHEKSVSRKPITFLDCALLEMALLKKFENSKESTFEGVSF